jgi:hypothetical protein
MSGPGWFRNPEIVLVFATVELQVRGFCQQQ